MRVRREKKMSVVIHQIRKLSPKEEKYFQGLNRD